MSFRDGKIYLKVPILALFLVSCATLSPKVKEYGELQTFINQSHDRALFKEDNGYLVDEMSKPDYTREFGKKYCGFDTEAGSRRPAEASRCDELYKHALISGFAERYFATNREAIEERCKKEPVACHDPKILEYWIRNSHNEAIEQSRKEKLDKLEAWRNGKLNDDELHAMLHLEAQHGS